MRSDECPERMVITDVSPQIDGGRFPIKRVLGERVVVEATIVAEGHDILSCALHYRHEQEPTWTSLALEPLGNDRWRGAFTVSAIGRYQYQLKGWVDRFTTWRRDTQKKHQAGQEVGVERLVGAVLLEEARDRAVGADAAQLQAWADALRADDPIDELELALGAAPLMERYPDQRSATRYDPGLAVVVNRENARFSTWYEMFPRSCATEPQIMAQVKEAYTVARRGEAIGPIFHQAFERAFAAGKRVRTETHIGERAVSVSYDAVELAKKI